MQVEISRVDWPYATPFRIASHVWSHARTVRVELTDQGITGRGEAAGVFYHGETAESVLEQLTVVRRELVAGVSRAELPALLPPGGARSAIDCARSAQQSFKPTMFGCSASASRVSLARPTELR